MKHSPHIVRVLDAAATARGFHTRNGRGVSILQVHRRNVVFTKNGVTRIAPKLSDSAGEYFVAGGVRVSLRVHNAFRRTRMTTATPKP